MVHPGWLCLLQGSLLLLARARQSRGPAGACPLRGKVSTGACGGGLCRPPRRTAPAAGASSAGAAPSPRELRGAGRGARRGRCFPPGGGGERVGWGAPGRAGPRRLRVSPVCGGGWVRSSGSGRPGTGGWRERGREGRVVCRGRAPGGTTTAGC